MAEIPQQEPQVDNAAPVAQGMDLIAPPTTPIQLVSEDPASNTATILDHFGQHQTLSLADPTNQAIVNTIKQRNSPVAAQVMQGAMGRPDPTHPIQPPAAMGQDQGGVQTPPNAPVPPPAASVDPNASMLNLAPLQKMSESESVTKSAPKSVLAALEAAHIAETKAADDEAEQSKYLVDATLPKLQEKFDAYNKAEQDLTQAATIDPNRIYNNMSTGQKITAGISIALGALGVAFGAKSNAAIDVIDKAMDRDIAAQKESFANKSIAAQATKSVYKEMLNQLGSGPAAEYATRSVMLKSIGNKLDNMAANAPNQLMQANISKLKADIDTKYADNLAKMQSTVTTNISKDTARSGAMDMSEIGLKVPEKQRPKAVDEFGKLQKFQESKSDAINGIKQLQKIGLSLDPRDYAKFQDQRAELATKIIESVPGLKSVNAYRQIVDKMLPTQLQSASKDVIDNKIRVFEDFLDAHSPPTPTLDIYKVNKSALKAPTQPTIDFKKAGH